MKLNKKEIAGYLKRGQKPTLRALLRTWRSSLQEREKAFTQRRLALIIDKRLRPLIESAPPAIQSQDEYRVVLMDMPTRCIDSDTEAELQRAAHMLGLRWTELLAWSVQELPEPGNWPKEKKDLFEAEDACQPKNIQ